MTAFEEAKLKYAEGQVKQIMAQLQPLVHATHATMKSQFSFNEDEHFRLTSTALDCKLIHECKLQ